MRKAGLTCDHVLGLDLVTADGSLLRVDSDHDPDLYWALRGGGGDFGVVTHFDYRLHPLGPTVYGGFIGWTLDHAQEVFERLRDEIAGAPDELQLEFILVTGPDVELIPRPLVGKPIVLLTITWMGADADEGTRAIAPFRERVAPAFEMLDRFPYAALQGMADPLSPHGRRSYTYAGFVADVPDELLAIGSRYTESAPGTVWPTVELYQMGGEVARQPEEFNAASAFRAAGWYYIAGGSWWDPAEDADAIDWVRSLDAELEPFRLPGRYINFVSDDDAEGQRESLGDRTYARLAEIKAEYDPDGVFARNPNKRAAPVAAAV
jgi:FAD/FMN-containing dehydrogenase